MKVSILPKENFTKNLKGDDSLIKDFYASATKYLGLSVSVGWLVCVHNNALCTDNPCLMGVRPYMMIMITMIELGTMMTMMIIKQL